MGMYCGCCKALEVRTIDPSWIGGEVDGLSTESGSLLA
jgi:hypothetical protein